MSDISAYGGGDSEPCAAAESRLVKVRLCEVFVMKLDLQDALPDYVPDLSILLGLVPHMLELLKKLGVQGAMEAQNLKIV